MNMGIGLSTNAKKKKKVQDTHKTENSGYLKSKDLFQNGAKKQKDRNSISNYRISVVDI